MNTSETTDRLPPTGRSRRQFCTGAAATGATLALGAATSALGAGTGAASRKAAALPTNADDIRELKLKEWRPTSMLKVKATKVDKPAFPVFDAHNHLRDGTQAKRFLEEMDAAGVRTVVHLDGMWGDELKRILDRLDGAHPGRFATFARIDFRGIDDAAWSDRTARQLEESFRAGAKGLKIHKSLGLTHRYKHGKLMPVDDPNLCVDFCARISELGRQPYTARRFLIKYQDRVLFGTDTRPDREAFRIYYRFLETDDEYFDCAKSHHLQGFWMIYGVHLPPEVLRKIYHQNADRIILGAVT